METNMSNKYVYCVQRARREAPRRAALLMATETYLLGKSRFFNNFYVLNNDF